MAPLRVEFSIRGDVVIARKEESKYKTLTKNQVFKYVKLLKEESFGNDIVLKTMKNHKNNIKERKEIEKIVPLANEYNADKVLKMILGIQSIILQFINENADIE